MSLLDTNDGFLEALYWILLGRPLDDDTRKTLTRNFELGQSRDAVMQAAMASSEFRQRYHDVLDSNLTIPGEDVVNRALGGLGATGDFTDACYSLLLGRESDPDGRAYYVSLLEGGQKQRLEIVYSLLHSDEFADRYTLMCPSGGRVPVDVQLCELANPAKWDNTDWRAVMHSLRLPAEKKLAMHRKAYEFTQTAWGLQRLGALTEDATVLSVGAGHESLGYWLANRVRWVIATDLYPGEWEASAGAEGDARVITHPEEFAPFEYRKQHLRFLRMDGRRLSFRDGAFDVAYSLSSIEHFGGFAGAREAVEEMARVLKPGGVLALATEWRVSGPSGEREGIFEPAEVRALVDMPSLELVEPLDDRVWQRYEATPVDLRRNRYETPHMLLSIDGTVFTSVMLFLRKR